MDILSKANSIVSEYDKIIKQMMDNDIMLNQEKMTLLSREKSALDDSYQLCKQYIDLNNQLSELDEMRNDKITNFENSLAHFLGNEKTSL